MDRGAGPLCGRQSCVPFPHKKQSPDQLGLLCKPSEKGLHLLEDVLAQELVDVRRVAVALLQLLDLVVGQGRQIDESFIP